MPHAHEKKCAYCQGHDKLTALHPLNISNETQCWISVHDIYSVFYALTAQTLPAADRSGALQRFNTHNIYNSAYTGLWLLTGIMFVLLLLVELNPYKELGLLSLIAL